MKTKYIPKDKSPIAVVYKKKYGKKPILEVFKDQRCPDRIISVRSSLLPKDCEILEVGVGRSFISAYKKKYKI